MDLILALHFLKTRWVFLFFSAHLSQSEMLHNITDFAKYVSKIIFEIMYNIMIHTISVRALGDHEDLCQ